MNEPFHVSVTSGSRLHVGLTRFRPVADPDGPPPLFGGIGVMIDDPVTTISFRSSEKFATIGSERLAPFISRWCEQRQLDMPKCIVELVSSPPAHSGLGSGTQLAHGLALGLAKYFQCSADTPQTVARLMERGKRSMIGSFGFCHGGLIADTSAVHGPAELATRLVFPSQWRAVLVLHLAANKKFGLQEQAAFDNILAEQVNRSRRLESLIANHLIPAIKTESFSVFCETVSEYGRLSGEYYLDVQGGTFNGPVITSVVDTLLRLGATGVGQSSWGPVVFSWCEDQQAAEELLARVEANFGDDAMSWIAKPLNEPATIHDSAIARS